MTLDEFIKELQKIQNIHGGDFEVSIVGTCYDGEGEELNCYEYINKENIAFMGDRLWLTFMADFKDYTA